jgi:hypothetical protein
MLWPVGTTESGPNEDKPNFNILDVWGLLLPTGRLAPRCLPMLYLRR